MPIEPADDRYRPTLVYAREDAEMHTRLCLYNYYSELIAGRETEALARVELRDRAGGIVATAERRLPHRGQLQLDLAELAARFDTGGFEGTAGVTLVPDPLPPLPPGRWFASGFYVRYGDAEGHLDMGHEWEPARPAPGRARSFIQFLRPAELAAAAVIAINVCDREAGGEAGGEAAWRLRLRRANGTTLAERAMPPLPPRGCGRYDLAETFDDWPRLARANAVLAVEALGSNLAGPLSLLRHRNGDFSLHHF